MDQVRTLRPTEIVGDKPFTNPDRIAYDVNALRFMIDQLHLFLENDHLYSNLEPPIIIHKPSRDKWYYRLVIARPEQLLNRRELAFVGFLGHRREDANLELADEFDALLVSEIPDYPGLLSYSTMALSSGDFSNLVVFTDTSIKQEWSRSKTHEQAVQKISPNYYVSIKLYNGHLPSGIVDSNAMQLARVKYYDFQVTPRWHAVREFTGGS